MVTLYVITEKSSGSVKVGIAKNLKSRLSSYETHNPSGVNLIDHRAFPCRSSAARAEAFVHRGLKKYLIKGEWFSPESLDEALALLQLAPCRDSIEFHQD